VYEFKLLIGDQFLKRFHWGLNFVWKPRSAASASRSFRFPAA